MKRWLCRGLWIWAALVVLSNGYRLFLLPEPALPEGMHAVTLPERRADGSKTGRTMHLAYREVGEAEKPVVVVLHGSPVASGALEGFIAELAGRDRWRVLAPDLPGMGASTTRVADYSVAAHGHAVIDLLDALEISSAHLAGYSLGGAVALEVAGEAPTRVESLSLLAATGVQEYELFGSYALNHSVHWLQWAILSAVEWGVPHFGLFARQPLNVSYARNFLDTDQRPLRGMLAGLDGPVLIVHGEDDQFVPVQAAREHARLVPQAQLEVLPGNHLTIIFEPGRFAEPVARFLRTVERGEALRRGEAPAERVAASARPFERDRSWRYQGIGLVLVVLLLMGATLVSEDLTCIGAGLLAAYGLIPLPAAIGACFAGIFLGDLGLYAAGRTLGRPALRRRPFRWIVSEVAERRAEAWFHRRGAVIILASRFLPGTRAATYFTAGVLKAPFARFILFFGVAAAIWTPALVGLASLLGERMVDLYHRYEGAALPVVLAAGLVLYLMLEYGTPALTWRGRRLLLGKWRRLSRWEYWPLWAFNAPVFLGVLWLVLVRYRRPTLFTLCNPAMPHGGFIGERKSEILAAFPAGTEGLLPWALCPAGETLGSRLARLEAFQRGLASPWPVVIKPDEGQRGAGVAIVRSRAQAEEAFAATSAALILQAHAAGEEYGVFYVRFPCEESGRITSITHKVFTAVTGDGVRTLEELILADDRAVDRGEDFLERMADRLETIPAAGEVVRLVELGTHARGASFLDGGHLCTPALAAAVERMARAYPGFHYGRFDLRAPDEAAFRAGRDLKLIEVNGLTSEPTHIYAPGASLLAAWRTLLHHWHLAIRIGREVEVTQGLRPTPLGEFARWWWHSHWRQRRG
ncbi:MAG: alpha/beta fold hydrolase [Opitutales bacterium]